MAKITTSALKTAVKTYVDASKQAGTWVASTNNFAGLLDKIGKQVSLAQNINDPLAGQLDGDELPLGKTIEEFLIDLTLPEAFSTENVDDNITPNIPSVEEVSYSYTLGRDKIKTTIPYDNFDRACLSAEGSANLASQIMERFNQSYDLVKFYEKKQLLANAADKAVEAGLVETVAAPVDTATGEAFIEAIKKDVEEARFPHEGGLNKALIGAAPELTLYVKKGIIPSVEVKTIAGAFQKDELALPCKVVVVDEIPTSDANVYAVLVDPRGIKLHTGYESVRSQELADFDMINFVKHYEHTGFISKYCFIKVIKSA
jgi:hypothetical protein